MGVSDEISDALRNETPLPNPRLEALRTFTLGVAQKVMSNYTNHLAITPVDVPFRAFDWPKAA